MSYRFKAEPMNKEIVAATQAALKRKLAERLGLLSSTTNKSRGLMGFVEDFWHVLEPQTPFVSNWHINVICDHLEACSRGQIQKLIINVPPGHMKSLICNVFWPAWEWTKNPGLKWMFTSYNTSLSVRDSLKMRRLIESAEYQAAFGGSVKIEPDQNAKQKYETTRRGFRMVVPIGSSTGERCDRLIIDDPNNATEMHSPSYRENIIESYRSALATRSTNEKTWVQVCVMQRLHQQDLSGFLADLGGWDQLILPAEYERGSSRTTSLGLYDKREGEGELLWPEKFPRASVESLKHTLGAYNAAGQLQQRPSPLSGGIFKRHHWRFWIPQGSELRYIPIPVRQPDGSMLNAIVEEVDLKHLRDFMQSWDMAFKDTKDSAFVVGQVWATLGANRYLVDQVRDRMDFVRTCRAVKALTAKHPRALRKLVEEKANGAAVISALRAEIPGLTAWNPDKQGSKEARANAVTPLVEAGNIYLPHPSMAPWVHEFIDEASNFPNGSYADQVDSMTQALLRYNKQDVQIFV